MKYGLKELRARTQKTQQEVSKDLKISVQTYNSWEKNLGKVKLSNAKQLADYFNVTLDDFLFAVEHE